MKIHPVVAEIFRANGQTDITGIILAFRNFAYAPKKNENWYVHR